MTTNLDIIKRAMKKLHVLPAETEPSAGQAFDGMALLKSLFVELIGSGSLGRLNDVLATSNYTAKEYERIRYDAGSVTITLPTSITSAQDTNDYGFVQIDYGAIYSNYPRPPLNLAVIVKINTAVNGLTYYYIWNTYAGGWVDLNAQAKTDDFPLPPHLVDGFAALLAEAWAPDWDQEVSASVKRQANLCRVTLSRKPDSQSRNTSSCSQYM